jgi:hypothetical protein
MTEMPDRNDMNDRRDERFVDELLDSALAQYAQAEPRPGLEARLLARLRAEPEPAAFGWRWLPMAVAAAVVLAAVLYFAGSRESRPPEVAVRPKPALAPRVSAPPTAPGAQTPSAPVVSRASAKQPSPRAPAATAPPRREQFFKPTALSEQEAALMRFVSQTPPDELRVLARQSRAEPIPELRVDALEIPPVVVGETESQ